MAIAKGVKMDRETAVQNLLALSRNPYPGRGLVLGMDESGQYMVQIYWIMGRSENSRNRVLTAKDGKVFTEPADPAKVKDPSLIIYNAMRGSNVFFVVSNGCQTDDIFTTANMAEGLMRHKYEPDSPNFTPRISGLCHIYAGEKGLSAYSQIAVLSKSPWSDACYRALFEYGTIPDGLGYCVTTYSGDGDLLPAFDDKPFPLIISGDIDVVANSYWGNLNPENRVALVVKFISIADVNSIGKSTIRIINRFTKI